MLEAPFFKPGMGPEQEADRGEPLAPMDDETPVSAIMTCEVISFEASTDIVTATRVMLERGISGAPVLDETGRPVGMVSKTDLLEAWHAQSQLPGPVPAGLGAEPALAALPVKVQDETATAVIAGDIMVPYLLAVSSRAPISLAAALMAYEGVHRLLVLNESNQMVGIVSALDVLRWLAQLSGFCLPRYTQRQRG